jgi:hypothetical protein
VLGFPIQVKNVLVCPSSMKALPNELAGFFIQLIAFGLAPDDRSAPIRRGKPHRFVEEEGLCQDDATYLKIFIGIVGDLPVMEEALAHLRVRSGPVTILEGFPGQTYRERRKGRKDSSPGYQVPVLSSFAAVQFEEENITLIECTELGIRRRLPEIDFVYVWLGP